MKQRQRQLAVKVVATSLVAAAGIASSSGQAQTLMEEWAGAKLPAPPALKPATINPAETALPVMDFTTQTCSAERHPRCAASVPKVQKLVADARARGAPVIYSVAVQGSTAADILKELTPAAGELVLPLLGPDKFIVRSKLARIAVLSRGGRSQHEHKARYAHSGTSSAPAPGASARRTAIVPGLNFLSVDS